MNRFAFSLLFSPLLFIGQQQAYMGVTVKNHSIENDFSVRISAVLDDGPAKFFGLKDNDLVLALDGDQVNNVCELNKVIRAKAVGETLTVEIDREGERLSKTIVLEEKTEKRTYSISTIKTGNQSAWTIDNTTLVYKDQVFEKAYLGSDTVYAHTQKSSYPQSLLNVCELSKEVRELMKKQDLPKQFGYTKYFGCNKPSTISTKRAVQVASQGELTLFPNPASSEITLFLAETDRESSETKISVFSASGALVYTVVEQVNRLEKTIDVSSFESGIYLVRVQTSLGIQTTRFHKM